MSLLSSIIIILAPILDYYVVANISLFWICGAVICTCSLIRDKGIILISRDLWFIFIFPLLLALVSFNGFFILNNKSSLVSALIGLSIDTVIYYFLWANADFEKVFKFMHFFAYIAVGYCLMQMFCTIVWGGAPNGQIPFLSLNLNQGWVPSTWGFRFNSLFSEPSYFAIYLLPIFAYDYLNENYFNAFIFAIGIVLSSSSLGIIGLILVVLYMEMSGKRNLDDRIRRFFVFFVLFLGLCLIVLILPPVRAIVGSAFNKLANVSHTENDIRLVGYLDHFLKYNPKEMFLGVGQGQFANYFHELGEEVFNYSNSIVLTLLQFGIIGFFVFIGFSILLLTKSLKNHSFIFFLLLYMVIVVDSVMFSSRYYYMLFFIVFFCKQCKKTGNQA